MHAHDVHFLHVLQVKHFNFLFCINMTQINPMYVTPEKRTQGIERLKQLCPVSGECIRSR